MIPKLRPFQGEVLLALFPPETERNGIQLPEKRREKDQIGRQPAAKARVLEMGTWDLDKRRRMIPYSFRKGDVVLFDLAAPGRDLVDGSERFKLIHHSQILAVVEPA